MFPTIIRRVSSILFAFCLTTVNLACSQTENQQPQQEHEKKTDQDPQTSFNKIGQLSSDSIRECSGIAISRTFKKHFWVHNDSGDEPTLYLVNRKGDSVADVKLEGVKNRDFEDVVSFNVENINFVAIADVGDNARRRKQLSIHIIEEPAPDKVKKKMSVRPITTLHFRYEDKLARDCESLAYLPSTAQFLVCSKPTPGEIIQGKSAELFSIEFDLGSPTQDCIAKKIGTLAGGLITAMDCSSDGKRLVVRNYLYANLWSIDSGELREQLNQKLATRIAMPLQRQNEAICFDKQGKTLITTSEGKLQDIFEIKIE